MWFGFRPLLWQDSGMPAESKAIGPVVVGIDGSEASLAALRHAIREAGWRGAEIHVVHVLNVSPAVLHLEGDVTITTRELAESDRAEIWKRVRPILVDADTEVVEVELDGAPGETLIAYAEEAGASVLVVGPRGRGRVEKLFLGSTAEQAVHGATCDVLVVKSGI
jgi:nucleotide-binding universal stress UspA family protein